jgi:hypothetical protein
MHDDNNEKKRQSNTTEPETAQTKHEYVRFKED